MADSSARFDRAFFARSTIQVAKDLLGSFVIAEDESGKTAGRIVEVEAYLGPSDAASHAARLKNIRAQSMGWDPGYAYVYRSMGLHAMLNVVAKPPGAVGAILVRALEPAEGEALMRERRGVEDIKLLCSGPGKLCQALGITLDDHGVDLVDGHRIWLAPGEAVHSITAGPRIGISKNADKPWRFFETGSRFVSAHRRGEVVERNEDAAAAR
jgi:DNA-3-methyladenine glycosylase